MAASSVIVRQRAAFSQAYASRVETAGMTPEESHAGRFDTKGAASDTGPHRATTAGKTVDTRASRRLEPDRRHEEPTFVMEGAQ